MAGLVLRLIPVMSRTCPVWSAWPGLCAIALQGHLPSGARGWASRAIPPPTEGIAGLDPVDLQAMTGMRSPGAAIKAQGGQLRHRTKGHEQPKGPATAWQPVLHTRKFQKPPLPVPGKGGGVSKGPAAQDHSGTGNRRHRRKVMTHGVPRPGGAGPSRRPVTLEVIASPFQGDTPGPDQPPPRHQISTDAFPEPAGRVRHVPKPGRRHKAEAPRAARPWHGRCHRWSRGESAGAKAGFQDRLVTVLRTRVIRRQLPWAPPCGGAGSGQTSAV